MPKRKTNPYQLTDDEKLAVVDSYAQFRTTSQIVDQVMGWKPNAATGDTEKDRKHVRDAIRTCNPKSSAFSFQIALTAKRAEYLAERKGSLVAAVCQTADAFAQGLSDIKFDFSSVTATDLPKIVFALKSLVELMSQMGISVKNDISTAVRFGYRLDEHPANRVDGDASYGLTRRETWAKAEPYELAKSNQIETGTGRDADDVDSRVYPENYKIPDVHVKDLWDMLFASEDRTTPSVEQMTRDLCNPEVYDDVFGGENLSFEEVLGVYRLLLSDDWRSHTAWWKQLNEDIERECMAERREKINKLLAGDTESINDLDLERLAQIINRNKKELAEQAPSAMQNKNGDCPVGDSQDCRALPNAVETVRDLSLPDKPPTNGHAGAHQQP